MTSSGAAVATLIAGWLMIVAAVAKRQLDWRPRAQRGSRRRRSRRKTILRFKVIGS
jgi:hypothetical protein